jgi:NADH:ubiquinone oxidoreductase subunit E
MNRVLVGRVAQGAAGVAILCTLPLLVDHAASIWRTPGDTTRVAQLQERATTEPELAFQLHEERERQTNASLAHEVRARALAWALLVSGALFVACGKWFGAGRPPRAPTLEQAVAGRLGSLTSPNGGTRTSVRPVVAQPDDVTFVDELIAQHGQSSEAAIPILQGIQNHYRHLPDAALQRVCERSEITPAQIAGTSSFYAQFRRSPVGLYVVRVCHGTACHVAGAEQITLELRRYFGVSASADTDPEGRFTFDEVACVGCCSLAPVMRIEGDTAGHLTPASARETLDALSGAGVPSVEA